MHCVLLVVLPWDFFRNPDKINPILGSISKCSFPLLIYPFTRQSLIKTILNEQFVRKVVRRNN